MSAEASARDILRKHSKSFNWAGRFLSRSDLEKGACLYSICRQVDDLADDARTPEELERARRQLRALQAGLSGSLTLDLVQALDADSRCRVPRLLADIEQLLGTDAAASCAMRDLLQTMLNDLSPVNVADESELLGYAYGAAGTVGVMMCRCLGARDIERARAFAVDMGMAMQMTNIARDVLEDAQRGRNYLPRSWIAQDFSAEQICRDDREARHAAWLAVKRLVALAETYYASGWEGLVYLPARPRVAIAVACRVYRDIGRRILTLDEDRYWSRRVVVPRQGKIFQSLLAVAQTSLTGGAPVHNSRLHEPFGLRLPTAVTSRRSAS